jgi:excisionase family DNA binding protein
MDPILIRPEEAAQLLAVSRSKFYELLAQGVLPSVHIGRALRVPYDALRAFATAGDGNLQRDSKS